MIDKEPPRNLIVIGKDNVTIYSPNKENAISFSCETYADASIAGWIGLALRAAQDSGIRINFNELHAIASSLEYLIMGKE